LIAAEVSVGVAADVSVASPGPLFLVTCKTKYYKNGTNNIIIIIGNLWYRYLLDFMLSLSYNLNKLLECIFLLELKSSSTFFLINKKFTLCINAYKILKLNFKV
jgi:hypothetical protein